MRERNWPRILGLAAIGISAGLNAIVQELQAERRIIRAAPATPPPPPTYSWEPVGAEEPVRNTGRWAQ